MKSIFYFSVLFVTALIISSCSKDATQTKQLQGKWEAVDYENHLKSAGSGNDTTTHYTYDPGALVYTFSGSSLVMEANNGGSTTTLQYSFSLKDSKLTLTYGGTSSTLTITNLTDTQLSIKLEVPDGQGNPITSTTNFKKIK